MRTALLALSFFGCADSGVLDVEPADDSVPPEPLDYLTCEGDLDLSAVEQLSVFDYAVWNAPVVIEGDRLSYASNLYDPVVRVLDMTTGELVEEPSGDRVYLVARTPALDVELTRDGMLLAIDRESGEVDHTVDDDIRTWVPPVVAQTDTLIAYSSCRGEVGQVIVHDVEAGERMLELEVACDTQYGALSLSADGSTLATSMNKAGQIRVVDLETRLERMLTGHEGIPSSEPHSWLPPVDEIALSPNGQQLLSVGADAMMRRWDVQSGDMLHEEPTQRVIANEMIFAEPEGRGALTWSPDGDFFGWMDATGTLRISRACDGDDVHVGTEGTLRGAYALRIDPDVGWAAAVYEGSVQTWSIDVE